MTHDEAAKLANEITEWHITGHPVKDKWDESDLIDLIATLAQAYRERDAELQGIYANAARIPPEGTWWNKRLADMDREELTDAVKQVAAMATKLKRDKDADAPVIRGLQAQVHRLTEEVADERERCARVAEDGEGDLEGSISPILLAMGTEEVARHTARAMRKHIAAKIRETRT